MNEQERKAANGDFKVVGVEPAGDLIYEGADGERYTDGETLASFGAENLTDAEVELLGEVAHGVTTMNDNERKELLKQLAKEAIDVQDACNLSGVAHGFAKAMSKLCELGLDTTQRNRHPVAVMWSSKIASLCGSEDATTFSWAYEACKGLSAGEDERKFYNARGEPA